MWREEQLRLGLAAILLLLGASRRPRARRSCPSRSRATSSCGTSASERGETLPELKIHYRTLGTPRRNAKGVVENAVLVLHGTTGSGKQFFTENFAGVLFGPGQLLDASKYYLIVPDGIGHGESSRPSDGLRMRFPRYTYDDMVAAQYRLLTEGLKVDHLRLVLGTSMGGMHAWVWGEKYPDFMDGLVPLAALPGPMSGRNRAWRRMILDAIRERSRMEERRLRGAAPRADGGGPPPRPDAGQSRSSGRRPRPRARTRTGISRRRRRRAWRDRTPTISSTPSTRRATTTRRRASRRSRSRCSRSTSPTTSSTRRSSGSSRRRWRGSAGGARSSSPPGRRPAGTERTPCRRSGRSTCAPFWPP